MLVLIGPHWLQSIDGTRRIDDPNDWVRHEIEAGLQLREVIVIPVLLDGATAPDTAELPEAIKGLAARNAVVITGDDLAADIGSRRRPRVSSQLPQFRHDRWARGGILMAHNEDGQ